MGIPLQKQLPGGRLSTATTTTTTATIRWLGIVTAVMWSVRALASGLHSAICAAAEKDLVHRLERCLRLQVPVVLLCSLLSNLIHRLVKLRQHLQGPAPRSLQSSLALICTPICLSACFLHLFHLLHLLHFVIAPITIAIIIAIIIIVPRPACASVLRAALTPRVGQCVLRSRQQCAEGQRRLAPPLRVNAAAVRVRIARNGRTALSLAARDRARPRTSALTACC